MADEERTVYHTVKALSEWCVKHAEREGLKGKRADQMAFHMFCGASYALQHVMHPDRNVMTNVTALLVSSRGMKEVRDMASRPETPRGEQDDELSLLTERAKALGYASVSDALNALRDYSA